MTDDRIDDVRFTSGCAVSRAAASIMTQKVKGKSRAEVESCSRRFHELVTGKLRPTEQEARGLGELAAFSGGALPDPREVREHAVAHAAGGAARRPRA